MRAHTKLELYADYKMIHQNIHMNTEVIQYNSLTTLLRDFLIFAFALYNTLYIIYIFHERQNISLSLYNLINW